MGKKKILFQLNYLYHLPAVEPIIKVFASDAAYDVAFNISLDIYHKFGVFRMKKSQTEFIEFFGENVRPASNEQFDVVLSTDVLTNDKFTDALKCMVYHGPTFNKTVTYRELNKHASKNFLVFSESDFTKYELLKSTNLNNDQLAVVGFPKLDPYLNNEFDRDDILSALGLDLNKKTVLYAPTYKPTSIYDLIDHIFDATKDYNLIVKLHHYSWMGKYASRKQSRLFIKKVKKYDHAVVLPQEFYNITPLYAVADTLISEASGALTEFLISGNRAIIFNLNKKQLIRSNSEPRLALNNENLKEIFIQISDGKELKSALIEALHPSAEQVDRILKYKNKYFHNNDGKASVRIKDYIDNILF